MRQTSMGRKSSLNPVRVSTFSDKASSGRSEIRKGPLRARGSSVGDSSQIPRPRIRSESSERSSLRPSALKLPGRTAATTPVATPSLLTEFGHGVRGRSPSAERASALGAAKSLKKDTRSLTDKSYQNLMLSRIDVFFAEAQQASLLNNNGSLKPASLKIFVSASDFLLKLLECKQDVTLTNYMEELPKIAKKLHYPGVITKSWLKTANTMHSFPHVLAWLSWLVEICEVKDLANQTFQLPLLPFLDSNEGEVINRSMFISLLELYHVWNDADRDGEIRVENDYIEGIAEKCGITEEDMRSATNEVSEAENKEHEFRKNYELVLADFTEINDKLQQLVSDEAKQSAHLAAQEKFCESADAEIQQLNTDSKLLESESKKLDEQHVELNEMIKKQLMSIEERDEIVKECSQIQNYINRFHDHLDEIQKEVWTLDIKLTNSRDQFEKSILAFNRDIVISGDLDELKLPETFSAGDIVEILKGKSEIIMNFKDNIKKELNIWQAKIGEQRHRLESLNDRMKIIGEERNAMALKTSETRKCIQKLKQKAKREEDKLQEMVVKMEAEIEEIEQSLPDVEDVQRRLIEVQEKLDALYRKKSYLEQSAQKFFKRFFETSASHKVELGKLIGKMEMKIQMHE